MTTNYETAPSTHLVATHCAVCHRALRDAVSVERGIGPDCAERYGYATAQTEPAWDSVLDNLCGAHLCARSDGTLADHTEVQTPAGLIRSNSATLRTVLRTADARGLCNYLVHQIAMTVSGEHAQHHHHAAMIGAIRTAGFAALAKRLAENLPRYLRERPARLPAQITVTYTDGRAYLALAYLPAGAFSAYLSTIRAVEGRRFDARSKTWSIPTAGRAALVAGMLARLPSGVEVTIRSERGEMVLRGAA